MRAIQEYTCKIQSAKAKSLKQLEIAGVNAKKNLQKQRGRQNGRKLEWKGVQLESPALSSDQGMFSAASFSFSNRSLEVQAHDLELFHCARTGSSAAVGQGTSTVTAARTQQRPPKSLGGNVTWLFIKNVEVLEIGLPVTKAKRMQAPCVSWPYEPQWQTNWGTAKLGHSSNSKVCLPFLSTIYHCNGKDTARQRLLHRPNFVTCPRSPDLYWPGRAVDSVSARLKQLGIEIAKYDIRRGNPCRKRGPDQL